MRSGLPAQMRAVLGKQGVQVPMSDLFGIDGKKLLDELRLDPPCQALHAQRGDSRSPDRGTAAADDSRPSRH